MLRALNSLQSRSFVAGPWKSLSIVLQNEAPATKLTSVSVPQYAVSRSLGTDADKNSSENLLDSLSPSRKKFHCVLNEFKVDNFEHDTPSRFFKKIVKAIDPNQDGVITMEEFQTLLKNIGAQDKMTEQDTHEIFEELGVDHGGEKVITVESMVTRWTPFLKSTSNKV